MAGECTGTPGGCTYRDEGTCLLCGCDWVFVDPKWECFGTPDPCSVHTLPGACEDCGCDWPVALNIKVNVGDVWKDALEMKINIGDVWKPVVEIWQNIGDVWKRVF